MTTEALVPPWFSDFATTDPDEAHAFLRENYSDRVTCIRGSSDGFRMRHSQIRSGEVTVATMSHTMAVEHDCRPLGGLLVARVLGGTLERETAGETVRAGPGDVFVVARPDDAYAIRWDRIRVQVAWIDLAMLGEVAADDGDRPATVRFTGLSPVSPIEARHWRVTADYVMASLMRPGHRPASPLVVVSAARLLAAATLSTFPNTAAATVSGAAASTVPAARRPDSTPAMLRRVIGVMEERAHDDVSLFELAGAARVSPAELRQAFRGHLATSPGAYLRQIRLDRAHEELLYPDPDRHVVISEVAARWGFADHSAFAAVYRAAYGRTPEETLAADLAANLTTDLTADRRTSPGRPSPSPRG